jgi:hypothetical protein
MPLPMLFAAIIISSSTTISNGAGAALDPR